MAALKLLLLPVPDILPTAKLKKACTCKSLMKKALKEKWIFSLLSWIEEGNTQSVCDGFQSSPKNAQQGPRRCSPVKDSVVAARGTERSEGENPKVS
jgi:hypothetical protein